MSHFHKRLRYDPSATLVDNQIIAEKNYLLDGNIIKPKYSTYFFYSNHQIKGFNNANPLGVVLVDGVDYNLVITSADYTDIIGINIYSHAVLTNLTFDSVEFTYQALGSDIYYDPTGIVPENHILNEIFPIGSITKVKPYNFTHFFATGLVIKGHTQLNPGGTVLVVGGDYTLSAVVEPYTSSYGTNIHSYFELKPNVMSNYEWITFSYHALGNYLPYDASGTSITNNISNEIHTPTTSVCIVPLANSAFTKGSFVAKGYNNTYPSGIILKEINDYFFSPMYLTYSQDMAKEIYSYIVLTTAGLWESVEIEYHATGGSIDATLFAEISNAGAFDKNDPLEWMDFKGQLNTLSLGYFNDEEPDQSFLRIFNNKLNEIKVAIENLPAAPTIQLPDYITIAFNDVINQLNNQQSYFNNAIGELSTYGSLSTRIKEINGTTYTIENGDLGYTLIFTHTSGCAITVPNTLPANMWFKVLQNTLAGQISWADNVPAITFFNSGAQYLTTKDPGDLCTFLRVGTNKYLTTSTRIETDAASNFVLVNTDTLTIDANAHNNKILVFIYASGDVTVTVPDTLPDGMRWKEYKVSPLNKVIHTTSGTTTLVSANGIKNMDRQGDSLEFIKLESGVHTYLISSNRDSLSGINRIKVIDSNNYAITNVDNGHTLLFTSITNGVITISDDLQIGFACQIYKTVVSATAVFTITYSGNVTIEGNYNSSGLSKTGELIDVRQHEPNKYILNTNQKDLPNNIVTTTALTNALAALTNKPVRTRQTVMSGELDGNGQANWLKFSGVNVISENSQDRFLTFGDGFDEFGERNYIVKIPAGTSYTWAPELPDLTMVGIDQTAAQCKFLYIDLDPVTGNLTTGYSKYTVEGPPLYSINPPASGNGGQFWYPTDHRHRGKIRNGANWIDIPDGKLRLYVGFVDTHVYSFCYNGTTVIEYSWNNSIVAAGPNYELVPFNGDNCFYETEIYLRVEVINDSLNGMGYEIGEIIKAPLSHIDGGFLHGFEAVRKPDLISVSHANPLLSGISRYKAFHLFHYESDNSRLNKVWVINRTNTNSTNAQLDDFKFIIKVNRSF